MYHRILKYCYSTCYFTAKDNYIKNSNYFYIKKEKHPLYSNGEKTRNKQISPPFFGGEGGNSVYEEFAFSFILK